MSKDCTPSSSFRRRLVHKNNSRFAPPVRFFWLDRFAPQKHVASLHQTGISVISVAALLTKAVSLRSPQLRSSWYKNLCFALLSIKTKTHKSSVASLLTNPVFLIVWVITHGSNKTGIIGCLGHSSGVFFPGQSLLVWLTACSQEWAAQTSFLFVFLGHSFGVSQDGLY